MLSCELVFDQIWLMLVPALENRAAEAKATKASIKVYSMRSWPRSSCHKRLQSFFIRLKYRRVWGRALGTAPFGRGSETLARVRTAP